MFPQSQVQKHCTVFDEDKLTHIHLSYFSSFGISGEHHAFHKNIGTLSLIGEVIIFSLHLRKKKTSFVFSNSLKKEECCIFRIQQFDVKK